MDLCSYSSCSWCGPEWPSIQVIRSTTQASEHQLCQGLSSSGDWDPRSARLGRSVCLTHSAVVSPLRFGCKRRCDGCTMMAVTPDEVYEYAGGEVFADQKTYPNLTWIGNYKKAQNKVGPTVPASQSRQQVLVRA